MKTIFKGKKITGMLGVLPERESYFDDEVGNYSFPSKQTMRLKKVMGYEKHRLSKDTSSASDFCIYGLKHMMGNGLICKEEIGAVIVITLSPDYFLPQISNIIQGECQLPHDVLCLDIAQGCCGFLVGLMQAFMLLEHMNDKKVLVFNTDILSHKVSKKDRNDFPLIGDATTITVVENDNQAEDVYFNLYMNGSERDALIIPAGGFKTPSTNETAELKDLGDGNFRALNHMHMDGTAVFSFVQTKVPPMIDEILQSASLCKEDVDYYLFHQPNKFMLKKLSEKIGVTEEKLFMNIVEKYGNPSGASIPMVIMENLGQTLYKNKYKCCLSGFGSGLAWGAAVMDIGDMKFCEMMVSNL